MNARRDITEVSDPRDMTIDEPPRSRSTRSRSSRATRPTTRSPRWSPCWPPPAGGTSRAGPAGTQPVGPPGRQAALLDLQLAAGDAAGADAHAPMTRVVLGVGLTGQAYGVAPGRNRPARHRLRRRRGRRHRRAGTRRATPATSPTRWPRAKAERSSTSSSTAASARIVLSSAVIRCCYIDGRLRGKPANRRRGAAAVGVDGRHARACCYTGHCVIRLRDGAITPPRSRCRRHHSQFRQPTDADLTAYLASGEPLRVAGGFTLDGLGGWFVDGIEGDPSNVIGLSLPTDAQTVRPRRAVDRRTLG